MKKIVAFCVLLSAIGSYAQNKNQSIEPITREVLFDNNWLFIKDSVANAEQVNYDDSKEQCCSIR